MPSPRIAVVGGGIGGLAAAAFLHQRGLSCALYEQASELREIGAGVAATPNAVRLLRRLGVLDVLRRTAVRLEIGWDGIHSVIRATLIEPVPPVHSGLSAFRALVPARDAPEIACRPARVLWLGPDHHLVHYPVRAGELINLVAIAPAGDYTTESRTATATVDELLAEFAGWDPRLTSLIQAAATPGRWVLLDRQPLRQWSHGPITLLGDAAHPMLPFFAQGAAQAIKDAAALARCLAEDPSDPSAALRRYEADRIPRTSRIQEVSHARAYLNHLPDGPEQRARDKAFASVDPLEANGWIYAHDAAA